MEGITLAFDPKVFFPVVGDRDRVVPKAVVADRPPATADELNRRNRILIPYGKKEYSNIGDGNAENSK